ncbi:MAG: hypothetical protein WBW31_17910 [Candidatus Sulfotelmatobacter sp.]
MAAGFLFRRMLKIAHEDQKIQQVPVIRLLKEPPARRGFVTDDEFDKLLKLLPTHLRPLIVFLFFCGVRSEAEAMAIEWPQQSVQLHQSAQRVDDCLRRLRTRT